MYETVHALLSSGKAVAAYTPGFGGTAEAALKMCIGNGFGCRFEESLPLETLFGYRYGAFVLEVLPEVEDGDAPRLRDGGRYLLPRRRERRLRRAVRAL